jgi:hypothetical protein
MRNQFTLISLLLLSNWVQAADTPAPAGKPATPRWRHAIAVQVLIGADVSSGMDQLEGFTRLLLKVTDISKLPEPVPGATECYFHATAWSHLASERISIRTQRLQCYDAQDKEIPGKAAPGYAVDKDARYGIKSSLQWSTAAKELLYMGVGTQAKQNVLVRMLSSTINTASMGLSNEILSDNEVKQAPATTEAVRETRNIESLLPTLTLEPGREFDIVLQSTRP